jgi:hypothetical protein
VIDSSLLPHDFLKAFFLCAAGPGFGDAEPDLAHGRPPGGVPARVPLGELLGDWAQVVHGGRARLRGQPNRAPRGARRRHPCPGRLLRGEFSLASQVPFHVSMEMEMVV